MRIALIASALLVSACATSQPTATSGDKQLTKFMTAYTVTWNKHDAATIARDFYRMGPSVEDQTASLTKSFAALVAQGYDKSDIHEIKACQLTADTGWAGMHFSRLKTDGTPLPPKDRASSYDLKKFPDGWRIVKLNGGDTAKPLECPAAKAS
ncbi:MAG: hypothetical protein ABI740_11135 [Alphaproteobacteria bacterium]